LSRHVRPVVFFALGYANQNAFVQGETTLVKIALICSTLLVVLTPLLLIGLYPVWRGRWPALARAHYTLGLALLALFLSSFYFHPAGGAGEYNEQQRQHGNAEQVTTLQFMTKSAFWFQTFQNWQSEFLSVGAMVVLSIFLRQHGSPESKPVDAAHGDTGK
jgi:hypothetical protein